MGRTMNASREQDASRDEAPLALAGVALGCALALSLTAWCAGMSSALLTSGRTPRAPAGHAPILLGGLLTNIGAPWRAWPAPDRRLMPGELLLWWLAALPGASVALVFVGGVALLVREVVRDGDAAGDPRRSRPPLALLSLKPRRGPLPAWTALRSACLIERGVAPARDRADRIGKDELVPDPGAAHPQGQRDRRLDQGRHQAPHPRLARAAH